jgi:lysozyme family protein
VDVLKHEGGFVDDPDDLGGMTKYGISKRSHPNVDIKNLSKDEAVGIYYKDYWKPSKADNLHSDIQATYFDMVVNMGQGNAVRVLQRAINSVGGSRIAVDGYIGDQTISSSSKLKKKRLQAFRCLYYSDLILNNPSQEKFYYGWWKRAIEV